MNIRNKSLSIVTVVVLVLVILLTGASYFLVTQRFANLEAKETEIAVQRVQNVLKTILDGLESIAGDWAPWDDTYQFLETGNTSYVENNLVDNTFINLRLNFMLFFNQKGTIVYSKYFKSNPSQTGVDSGQIMAAIAKNPHLLIHRNEKKRISGILMTRKAPFLIAAHPIVTSDFKGPIRGTLIIGRALDAKEVEKISVDTKINLSFNKLTTKDIRTLPEKILPVLERPGEIRTLPLAANSIAGYVAITDLSNKPTLLLEITQSRDTYRYGLVTWRQNAIVLVGLGLTFILLLMFLFDRVFLNRLDQLMKRVNDITHSVDSGERLDIGDDDEIGQLAKSINTMLDALQSYHSEKIESEEYLRQLLDSINCGVMVVDAQDHQVLYINKAGGELFQGERDKLIGKHCHQLICPNEIGNCPVTDLGQEIDLSERRLLKFDGTTMPVIKSVAVVERYERSYLIESFFDISRLKEAEESLRRSEEKYRRFFEEDITGDFLISVDGRIIDCNPAMAKMFGCHHPDEIRSTVLEGQYPTKEDRRLLLSRLRRERHLENVELELQHRSGRRLYCTGNLIGQFDSSGILREVRGYLYDDTKRYNLEKDLRRAQKMEAIGTLAGGIAHDFNNILAGIMGYTEIALSELPETSPTSGRLKSVMKSAHRAKDLVHQILAFSRQSESENHSLSLKPIIKEVIKLMRAGLPTTIEIREQFKSDANVMANPVQIHQVVMNLCTNAAYAMKKMGGCLDISVVNTQLDQSFSMRYPGVRKGNYVCVSVKDTGPGIPVNIVDRIFDPFFTTKDKNEGTGLGLSVVHGIVSKLKGVITVESTSQGTTFDVYLPIVEDQSKVPSEHGARQLPTGSETIVFIDDEDILVEIGTHMLGALGYRAIGYSDSLKALEYIRADADQIDLVISDMTMPGLTGLGLVQRLREFLPHLPIIICTGYSEDISPETFLSLSVDEYVMKPMVIMELAAKIRKVLDAGRSALKN